MIDPITILGVVAATITTGSFLPQVIKTWKTRHTRDISAFMFTMLLIGIMLWFVYGVLRSDFPVVVANAVSFILVFAILFLKIKHG